MIHSKDLTDNQLKILRCLSDGLMRVRKQISDETGIIGKTTSNVLNRMELLDLVQHVEQKSKLGWAITDAGLRLIDDRTVWRQHLERDDEEIEPVEPNNDRVEIVPPKIIVADERPAEYFASPEVDYLPKAEIDLDEIRRRCVEFAVALRGEKGLDRIDVYSRAIERLANACLLLK